ncbi:hypothetical protein [Paraburkholderia tropica]|uniref:hypothetical protein n=1 Tax=Paraburkholderia tropica TaxID=92647 RepID=UPI002AB68ADA|nr:hypothetical protein [Paraburkholderia tropica]
MAEEEGSSLGIGFAFGILFALGLMFAAFGIGFAQLSATAGGVFMLAVSLAGVWRTARTRTREKQGVQKR